EREALADIETRDVALREASHAPVTDRSQHGLERRVVRSETRANQPDERDLRGRERIADRRSTAARVPPQQALRRKPNAREAIGAGGDLDARRRGLEDFRSAVLVENLGGTPEEVREGLAVVAVADAAVAARARYAAQHSAQRAARAADREIPLVVRYRHFRERIERSAISAIAFDPRQTLAEPARSSVVTSRNATMSPGS